MEAKLVVVGGKANRSEVKLKLPTMIGRGRDADLTVAHATVSRHHCLIFELEGVLVVRDNGSLNGTIIDGQKVQESLLKPGQMLTIGPLTFRAEYEHNGHFPDLNGDRLGDAHGEAEEVSAGVETSSESDEQTVKAEENNETPLGFDVDVEAGDASGDEAGSFDFLKDDAPEAPPAPADEFRFLDEEDGSKPPAVSKAAVADSAKSDGSMRDSGEVFRLADGPPAAPAAGEKGAKNKKGAGLAKAPSQQKVAPPDSDSTLDIKLSEAGAAGKKDTGDAALDDFLNSLGLDN